MLILASFLWNISNLLQIWKYFYLGIVLITALTIVKYFDILILSVPVEPLQLQEINEINMKHQEGFRVNIIRCILI